MRVEMPREVVENRLDERDGEGLVREFTEDEVK